jgi:endonuclease YncB( thermonuclease family)
MKTSNWLTVVVTVIAFMLLGKMVRAEGSQIEGTVTVVDGDTLIVGYTHVRLKGVDAAELGTPLGEKALQAMVDLAQAKSAVCELTGEKTYEREVGYCSLVDGTDLNKEIIRGGWALACARYSDRYVGVEQPSQLARQPRSPYCVERGKKAPRRVRETAALVAPVVVLPSVARRWASPSRALVCAVPTDRDSRGRLCGARAASVRAGGR